VTDVTKADDAQRLVAETVARFGALHVLVNNAGIAGAQKRFTDLEFDEYLETVAVNQHGTFLGMRAAAPAIARSGGGSIVNVSSVNGQFGQAFGLPYCASKFAVAGMTKVAALELGSSGIRVNSIHPGAIDTPMLDADVNGVDPKSMFPYHKLPAGRIGAPDDVARLALFLASDESAYCTGAEFTADGGQTTGIGLPMFRMPPLA
jgi:3alpha(or 20beta)-hydroxysteroid dehydrogenase